jgi:hypothetical protein
VRQIPSTSAEVVGYRNDNDPVQIIGGPQLVDGEIWWMVLFQFEGEGWIGWMRGDLLGTFTPTPAVTATTDSTPSATE